MHTQHIDYHHNDLLLQGYLAHDENITTKRPAILVSHDWTGRNDFACKKAENLAKLGYVAFALDMFGKGILGNDKEEKTNLITPLVSNRTFLQERILKAYEVVKNLPMVDANKIAAIGFCFGGLCVLDLARTGEKISGVVSFHGLLHAPENHHPKKIHAKILALHGHDDPMAPPETVLSFETEMTKSHADWQVHVYGNTMHAFTNPVANDKDFGTVYESKADARSWIAMKNFLAELFELYKMV